MRTIVAECTVEVVAERSDVDHGDASPPRSSTASEADKVRLQQQIRRKTKLARRALAAHRGR